MAADPTFLTIPKLHIAQVTTANTARDGSGTPVSVAAGSGSYYEQILQIIVEATVSTTAGMVRFFLSADTGTTKRMYDEVPVGVITVSASVDAFRAVLVPDELFLIDASTILYATTHNTETFNIIVSGIASA